VTENPIEILASIRSILGSHAHLSLASQGMRIWSEVLSYRVEAEEILCKLDEDSQTLANIRLNPRVSFCVGSPRDGRSINGNGVARFLPGGGVVTIAPYRFAMSHHGPATPGRQVVEKRKLRWQSADPWPVGKGAPAGIRMKMKFWLKAARSVSFPLSYLPIVLGTVLAFMKGAFDPVTFLLALLGGVSAHAGVNLISDFNDFRRGVDTTDALSSHPGALVDEVVQPESILTASTLMFLVASVAAGFLLPRAGYSVIVFALAGLLGGYFYTGGPLAYKYRGLGELFISLLMGPAIVMGAYVVQTGRFDLVPLLLSLSLGSLVGSVTLANNLRDVQDDMKAGIFTLPMGLRVGFVKRLYYVMLGLPFVIVAALVAWRVSYLPMLLVLLSIPMAVKAIKRVRGAGDTPSEVRARAADGRYPLNSIKLHFQFSMLLILGSALVVLLSSLGYIRL